jgi:hypothetical protein
MATTTAKASGGVKNNNGGTVIGGGNVSPTGPISQSLLVKDLNANGIYGSKIVQNLATSNQFTDDAGLMKARRSGTLAYFPNAQNSERNFIIRGAGSDSAGKINNSSSALLNSTGSEFAGVPRYKANTVNGTQALGNPTWTYPVLPGSGRNPGLTRGATLGSGYLFTSTTDNQVAGVDEATNNTRSIPGELTYRTGAPLPITSNFKAIDSAE